MYKYGVIAFAALVVGCSPKSNTDEAWKADCATFYSQSNIDYFLCMRRKKEEADAKSKESKKATEDTNDVRTSKVGHTGMVDEGVNKHRADEIGAEGVL